MFKWYSNPLIGESFEKIMMKNTISFLKSIISCSFEKEMNSEDSTLLNKLFIGYETVH